MYTGTCHNTSPQPVLPIEITVFINGIFFRILKNNSDFYYLLNLLAFVYIILDLTFEISRLHIAKNMPTLTTTLDLSNKPE